MMGFKADTIIAGTMHLSKEEVESYVDLARAQGEKLRTMVLLEELETRDEVKTVKMGLEEKATLTMADGSEQVIEGPAVIIINQD